MRKINWEAPLSDEDIAFLNQTGIIGIEDRIEWHQARFAEDSGDGSDGGSPDDVADDYDQWKVAELETEVGNRNAMENTTNVTVVGTGKDGKVLKQDLVDGLRGWDRENPDALA